MFCDYDLLSKRRFRMSKIKFVLLANFILFSLLTNGFTQSIEVGITGGYFNILKPGAYSDKVSDYGLELQNGYILGGKMKVSFSDLPVNITGLVNYLRADGDGIYWGAPYPWS